MKRFFKRCCESKRECITYLIVFLWLAVGIIASYFETSFTALATYFISLTGFVALYIFGESVRKSKSSSIFLPGTNSKREVMMYVTIVLWLIAGVLAILQKADLISMSTYFAALTPFVGSYIIGETFKKEISYDKEKIEQINS